MISSLPTVLAPHAYALPISRSSRCSLSPLAILSCTPFAPALWFAVRLSYRQRRGLSAGAVALSFESYRHAYVSTSDASSKARSQMRLALEGKGPRESLVQRVEYSAGRCWDRPHQHPLTSALPFAGINLPATERRFD